MYEEATVIYSDVLFLLNFALDYLCLFITSRLLNIKTTLGRLAIASALGGLYSFLPYLVKLPVFVSLPLHIAFAALLCLISFESREPRRLLPALLGFIVSGALLGGMISGLYSLASDYSDGIYREPSLGSFLLILALSAAVAWCYSLICRRKINTRSSFVRIRFDKNELTLNLLCDSGNLVTEPFSALPVIIVSAACFKHPYDDPEREGYPLPLRAVPYATGNGRGCYLAFRPDSAEVRPLAGKPKPIDVYIAIDTVNKSFSGYDGIMPTSIL
ncbi:MAG: sigma-E processing peptidase SpoIIGA [Clostridia bacterium]|nr:sigma-E processing peptidase SpoIIGA [Clostridia bacterium]